MIKKEISKAFTDNTKPKKIVKLKDKKNKKKNKRKEKLLRLFSVLHNRLNALKEKRNQVIHEEEKEDEEEEEKTDKSTVKFEKPKLEKPKITGVQYVAGGRNVKQEAESTIKPYEQISDIGSKTKSVLIKEEEARRKPVMSLDEYLGKNEYIINDYIDKNPSLDIKNKEMLEKFKKFINNEIKKDLINHHYNVTDEEVGEKVVKFFKECLKKKKLTGTGIQNFYADQFRNIFLSD